MMQSGCSSWFRAVDGNRLEHGICPYFAVPTVRVEALSRSNLLAASLAGRGYGATWQFQSLRILFL